MDELIRRGALIKNLKNSGIVDSEEDAWVYSFVIAAIEETPIVDAVPVVHGEWIDTQPDYHSGFYGNAHKCSNCNDYYTTEYDDLFFCPRCGAKMDGKKVQDGKID